MAGGINQTARRARVQKGATARWVVVDSRIMRVTNHFSSHRKTSTNNSTNEMAEEQAAHHLLNVLEERGLHVDLDKILLGFEDEDTKREAASWVDEYLHEDTLLTKEELEL